MIRTRSSSERRKSEAGAARRLGRIAAADLAPFALLGAVALGVLIVRAGPRWVAIAGQRSRQRAICGCFSPTAANACCTPLCSHALSPSSPPSVALLLGVVAEVRERRLSD